MLIRTGRGFASGSLQHVGATRVGRSQSEMECVRVRRYHTSLRAKSISLDSGYRLAQQVSLSRNSGFLNIIHGFVHHEMHVTHWHVSGC